MPIKVTLARQSSLIEQISGFNFSASCCVHLYVNENKLASAPSCLRYLSNINTTVCCLKTNTPSNAFISLVNDLISITGYGSVFDGGCGRIQVPVVSCAQTQSTAVNSANTSENKSSKGARTVASSCCYVTV